LNQSPASRSSGFGVASRGGVREFAEAFAVSSDVLAVEARVWRGAQGRSKFGGRAESITKPAPSRRNASAPRARQRLRPITVAAQSDGASRVATMTVARRQSSSNASGASA